MLINLRKSKNHDGEIEKAELVLMVAEDNKSKQTAKQAKN